MYGSFLTTITLALRSALTSVSSVNVNMSVPLPNITCDLRYNIKSGQVRAPLSLYFVSGTFVR